MDMGTKDFYVYIFLDQRKKQIYNYNGIKFDYQPFYIGVGRNNRLTAHFTPSNLSTKNIKNNIINSIYKETGELPIHYRILEGLSQEEAFEFEINFIKVFGKIKDKTGVLSNLTDGGEGNLGLKHSDDFLNKLRKRVFRYNLDGVYINEYPSLKEAAAINKLSPAGIRRAIKENGTAGGFQWSYELKDKLTPKKKNQFNLRKSYIIYNKITGEKVKEFNSFEDIEPFFGKKVSFGNISSCVNGKIKSYLGYMWSFRE